jgi:hypothetical protein
VGDSNAQQKPVRDGVPIVTSKGSMGTGSLRPIGLAFAEVLRQSGGDTANLAFFQPYQANSLSFGVVSIRC